MKVLDLGCGEGKTLALWGVSVADSVIGVDVDESSLATARSRFPSRTYIHAAGEDLPFPNRSFDRIVSSVAVPYMNIPKALSECYRVLAPGSPSRLMMAVETPPTPWAWRSSSVVGSVIGDATALTRLGAIIAVRPAERRMRCNTPSPG
jgi:ubiquinone/menaquinone biosynthesis C-methylase UbiE